MGFKNISYYSVNLSICGLILFFSSSIVKASEDYKLNGQITSKVVSSGGEYELVATINQPGITASSGGDYEMSISVNPSVQFELIDYEELAIFASQWLQMSGTFTADLDGDKDVDLADLRLLAERWLDISPQDWHLK